MAEFDVDLFVIGGGSGGVRAARIAAGYGARVMIAEEYRMGGTCVIRGCVPKKLLVDASHIPSRDRGRRAVSAGPSRQPSFDWKTLVANKDKEIARLEASTPPMSEGRRRGRQDARGDRGCAHRAAVDRRGRHAQNTC